MLRLPHAPARSPFVPIATGNLSTARNMTRAKSPRRTKLLLRRAVTRPIVELDAEDKRAIDRAIESVRNGNGISLAEFRAKLQQL